MKLIVGLGNPGSNYLNTRHNLGFSVVEELAQALSLDWLENKKCKSLLAKDSSVVLQKPLTFMNLSGLAVKAAMQFYKINLKDLIVIHDDLDIDLGKHKTTASSRAAGHNGVQSIIDELGSQDFFRIRVGIRSDEQGQIPTEKYVLGNLTAKEKELIEPLIKKIALEIKKDLE